MQVFSVELLIIAAALFAAASYRYVYRVSMIRLIDKEYIITWTGLDKSFCWMAALEGVLFSGLSIHFGTTFGALAWVSPMAVVTGALIGRLFAVRHLHNFNEAVGVANGKRTDQIWAAQERFPSQTESDISSVASVGQAASIARNIAVDKAVAKWLRN